MWGGVRERPRGRGETGARGHLYVPGTPKSKSRLPSKAGEQLCSSNVVIWGSSVLIRWAWEGGRNRDVEAGEMRPTARHEFGVVSEGLFCCNHVGIVCLSVSAGFCTPVKAKNRCNRHKIPSQISCERKTHLEDRVVKVPGLLQVRFLATQRRGLSGGPFKKHGQKNGQKNGMKTGSPKTGQKMGRKWVKKRTCAAPVLLSPGVWVRDGPARRPAGAAPDVGTGWFVSAM